MGASASPWHFSVIRSFSDFNHGEGLLVLACSTPVGKALSLSLLLRFHPPHCTNSFTETLSNYKAAPRHYLSYPSPSPTFSALFFSRCHICWQAIFSAVSARLCTNPIPRMPTSTAAPKQCPLVRLSPTSDAEIRRLTTTIQARRIDGCDRCGCGNH